MHLFPKLLNSLTHLTLQRYEIYFISTILHQFVESLRFHALKIASCRKMKTTLPPQIPDRRLKSLHIKNSLCNFADDKKM